DEQPFARAEDRGEWAVHVASTLPAVPRRARARHAGIRRPKPIYVEIDIAADMDTVWVLTQTRAQHTRSAARSSRIVPTAELDHRSGDREPARGAGYRFLDERRMLFHTIVGTGTTIGERHRPDGSRTSALRFTTADRLSPLGEGRGYWRYLPIEG